MTYHDRKLPDPREPIFRKDAGDPFDAIAKRVGDLADATLKRVGEAEGKMAEVQATVETLAQKMARSGPLAITFHAL